MYPRRWDAGKYDLLAMRQASAIGRGGVDVAFLWICIALFTLSKFWLCIKLFYLHTKQVIKAVFSLISCRAHKL
jgi:hypothetical protein